MPFLSSVSAVPPASTSLAGRATYGAGGTEPYARALCGEATSLTLRRTSDEPTTGGRPVAIARFGGAADDLDRRVLDRARGAVLDVGCGPGRMVAAALGRDLPALGVDVSAAAVRLARREGLPVLHCSVFDLSPVGRRFATVLLLDGNIGIGGDPEALLGHCAGLLADGGNLLVEVDAEADVECTFTGVVTDDAGRVSDPFPWADVGRHALERHAHRLGLRSVDVCSGADRVVVEFEQR